MNESAGGVRIEAQTLPAEVEIFSRGLLRKLLLPTILAVLVYGTLLLYADVGAIVDQARSVSVDVLLFGTLLAVLNFVVRFFRWHFYLRVLDISISISESALVFLSGFAMSITPGKLGEVIKALLLKEAYSIPVARTGPIVLAERVTDLVGLLMLGAIGLPVLPHGIPLAAAACGLVVFLFACCTWRALGNTLIRTVTRIRFVAPLEAKLQGAYDALLDMLRPWPFVVGTATSFVAWGLHCVSLNVFASGYPQVSLSLQEGLLAYSAPLLAGTLAFIPGGLGVTEASMAGMLQELGGEAMTPPVATAITILSRLSSFWLAIALGFAALAIWRIRRRAARA